MDLTQPTGKVNPQSTNGSPLDGFPSALVDDPIYLVDDSHILTGSQTSPTLINLTAKSNQSSGSISINY